MKESILGQYINKKNQNGNITRILPLFHSCEGYNGKQIIADGVLTTKYCKVFKEKLLYLFYGKPAYPIGEKNEKNRIDAFYCPVCFVMDPNQVAIYRAFPFDTGAFANNLYEDFMHRGMDLKCFELRNSLTDILKYVSVMFGTNANYIYGICKQKKSDLMEVQALLNMFNANGAFHIDERANTIEIISKKNIRLTDAIQCLILPENLLRIKEIARYIKKNNIPYTTYKIRRLTAPERYNEVVFQLAMNYIAEKEEVE